MTEDELKALKGLPAPPPRPGAKAAALAAAMAAFDAPEKKIADAPQGNDAAPRPMNASHGNRRQKMRAPALYKIAAGIAVILVATPTAVYFSGLEFTSPEFRVASDDYRGARPLDEKVIEQLDRQRLQYERTPQGGDNRSSSVIAPSAGTLEERIQNPPRDAERRPSDPPAPPPAPPGQPLVYNREPSGPDKTPMPAGQSQTAMTPPPVTGGQNSGGGTRRSQNEPAKPGNKVALAQPHPRQETQQPEPLPRTDTSKGAPAIPKAEPQAAGRVAPAQSSEQNIRAELRRTDDRDIAVPEEENRDKFEAPAPNPVKQVATEPVSTFSIDVDTASYAFARRALNAGGLPPKASVRVEEMINYFPYDYPRPETAESPFQPTVTVVPAPWKPTNKLVHIGIKGYDVKAEKRPRANVVFLIDISGSMSSADKLPLVKNAFRLLVDELKPDDTVGIVTYASGSGIALEPTKVSEKRKILAAIERLGAGGSTAGAAGINDAYRLAEAHFDKEGVNRVILATDGDFNVGITNQDELKGFIERKRQTGIFLSILGVGEGNYNDAMMQVLAQNGNGTAAYVDTLSEARKVLVDEASSTLFTIAKDVKIQMEFNPAAVSEYRLIGYETRALAREDFNNDKVDAGEIGSGHTVTAIYEVTPLGAPKMVDDLRYGQAQPGAEKPVTPDPNAELGFLKLRYKLPNEDASKLITVAVTPALEKAEIGAASEDVRFSVAVAGFGQLLRGLPNVGSYGFDDVQALAQTARGPDPFGYRAEFLNLVRLAKSATP